MFFSKKKCGNCSEKVDNKWDFCPHCGEELVERPGNIFGDIDKGFKKVDKVFSLKPIKGISIMIGSGMEPKIKVKTADDYRKHEAKYTEKVKEKPVRIPKIAEEPETRTERIGNRQLINIKLPGVKIEDIEIKRLEQSIEVKAFAGDKAYFKLIPVPSNASINRTFEDEMLKIEVQR